MVESIDDVYTALFPTHGYELDSCGGGEINIRHPEVPEELALMSDPWCFRVCFIGRSNSALRLFFGLLILGFSGSSKMMSKTTGAFTPPEMAIHCGIAMRTKSVSQPT